MKAINLLFILFLTTFLTSFSQDGGNYYKFKSGDLENSQVFFEWESSGSLLVNENRTVDRLYNVITDIGLDKSGNINCSQTLQDFLENQEHKYFLENETVMLYFPSGTYKFEKTVLINKPNIIIKGDGVNSVFIFEMDNDFLLISNTNGVAIEDVKLARLLPPQNIFSPARNAYNIRFDNAEYCRVKGIQSDYCQKSHVTITGTSSNITVSGCHFEHTYSHCGGGYGYGVALDGNANHCRIENNLFEHLRHGIVLQASPKFNVVAYNASYACYGYPFSDQQTDANMESAGISSFGFPNISFHGGFSPLPGFGPTLNLLEGNYCDEEIRFDGTHDHNGPYNTLLRNRYDDINVTLWTFENGDVHDIEDQVLQNVHGSDLDLLYDGTVFQQPVGSIVECFDADISYYVKSYYLYSRPDFLTEADYPYDACGPNYSSNDAQFRHGRDENIKVSPYGWNSYACREPLYANYRTFGGGLSGTTEIINTIKTIRAGQQLRSVGGIEVSSIGDLRVIAGESIILNPGFIANYGSTFHAYTGEGCYTPSKRIISEKRKYIPIQPKKVEIPTVDKFDKISIIPNPSDGQFRIELSSLSNIEKAQLIDIQGKVVIENYNLYNNGYSFDVAEIPGLYLLRVIMRDGRSEHYKVIIQ